MAEETWDENGVPADVLRQNLKATRARIAALEAEISSLTPSGDVMDDVHAIQRALVAADRFWAPEVNADAERAALSRLTAKAQAYDVAMADNAALLGFVREQAAVTCEDVARQCGECASCTARAILDAAHSGTAVLEEHRKALDAAKTKGHEDFDRALRTIRTRMAELGETCPEGGLVGIMNGMERIQFRARNEGIERVALRFVESDMAATAVEIRAMKGPES